MSSPPPSSRACRPKPCLKSAFAGRSNAGKSTTINVLTRKTRLAFASKTPGRTQLINFFALSKKNEAGVREDVGCLVDLPGYGFAKASEDTRKTWSQLVGGYIAQRPNMVGLVIVMDARRPSCPPTSGSSNSWRAAPTCACTGCSTRPTSSRIRRGARRFATRRSAPAEIGPHVTVQLFSGMKKEGTEELGAVLEGWLGLNAQESPKE